jgi:peptidyl-prolyl cis-trans isomerase B (cyclophilin B)
LIIFLLYNFYGKDGKMKKFKIILLALFTIICMTGCIGDADDELLEGKHDVVIKVKNYGIIEMELDADVAPITVTNFINLVEDKFYDGLTFHRIMDGFMIQGGDPNANGTGGNVHTIKGEFSSNGVENSISHVRGVVSMARNGVDNNSASSQFFIVHQDSTFLDGNYAGFGHVTKGMDVVDKIVENAHPTDDNGTIPKDEQPVITSIRVKQKK